MNTTTLANGRQTATTLAQLLETTSLKIVLAESCTCGMAAALLGSVPGISKHLCGSCVTYRVATKASWLGIERQQIERDSAESAETTRNMAIGVLRQTPEAAWSAAITGNLGPGAGVKDGVIFICVARTIASCAAAGEIVPSKNVKIIEDLTFDLQSVDRWSRQIEAAKLLLDQLAAAILSDNR